MVSNELYTIVLDFLGGTFIAQASATSPHDSLLFWAESLSEADARVWKLDRKQLSTIIRDEDLSALTGCVNVWCLSVNIGNDLALINVVKTVSR